MAWARIDDDLFSHPKIMQAWRDCPASIGLWPQALAWAGRHLTDGAVSAVFVQALMPNRRQRDRTVGALVGAELWVPNGTGWQIHDWTDYNPPADDVRKKRDWDVTRKALERDRDLIAAIRARDQDRCRYCDIEVNWTNRKGPDGGNYDHVQPRGPNTLENVVTSCRRCNSYKGNRTPEQAGMTLLAPSRARAPARAHPEPDPLLLPASSSVTKGLARARARAARAADDDG